MQLRQIVAEAHAALCIAVDKEVHQLHDPLGRLIEGKGTGIPMSHLLQQPAPFGVFPGKEAIEQEAGEIKARDGQGRHRGTAAGHADDRDARLHGGLDQLVAGIGDAGRARVGDDRDALALEHLADEVFGLAVFVEFVVGDQLVADLQLAQQHHRAAGVLGGDDVHLLEDLLSPGGHIPGVSNGGGHDIELAGISDFFHGRLPVIQIFVASIINCLNALGNCVFAAKGAGKTRRPG